MKYPLALSILFIGMNICAQEFSCESPRSKVSYKLGPKFIEYCQVMHKGQLVKDGIYREVDANGKKSISYFVKGEKSSIPSSSPFYRRPKYSQKDCPPNFEYVDDSKWGDSFCVAKLEMRKGSKGFAFDESAAPHIENDPRKAARNCSSVQVPGFGAKFRLISNNQWMAAANEIELNEENWQTATLQGQKVSCLSPGNHLALIHSGGIKMCGYRRRRDNKFDWGEPRHPDACHKLKSGRKVCDMAGNAEEWVSWAISTEYVFLPKGMSFYFTGKANIPLDIDEWRDEPGLTIKGGMDKHIYPARKYKKTSAKGVVAGLGNALVRGEDHERAINRGGAILGGDGIYTIKSPIMVKPDGTLDYRVFSSFKGVSYRCVYNL